MNQDTDIKTNQKAIQDTIINTGLKMNQDTDIEAEKKAIQDTIIITELNMNQNTEIKTEQKQPYSYRINPKRVMISNLKIVP